MNKWIWTFTVLTAFVDVCIPYRCQTTMLEWESNPLACLMLQSHGFAGVILFRVALLAFAMTMGCVKTRLSWLVAPTWGAAHAYLLLTLLVLGPQLTILQTRNPWFSSRHNVGFFTHGFLNTRLTTGGTNMGGKTDEVKGRLKEAAGALTDNDKLRAEGKTDQAVGQVKQIAEKAVDKVEQAVKKVQE
jgi:uncharacterized protein YjbJ (UPF0337 family)